MRRLQVILLGLALMVLMTPSAGAGQGQDAPLTVGDVEFLGEVTFPTGFVFEGTEVGGLSSITYDQTRDVYYTISDDQGTIDPVRFYAVEVDVEDGSLDQGDVTFTDMTEILDLDDQPFAPGSLDPEGLVLAGPGQLYFSSEGRSTATPPIDPFVRRLNRQGAATAEAPVPSIFLPDANGTVGVRNNLGFESLTVTPDGKTLITATEAALAQDGPAADVDQSSLARILEYRLAGRQVGAQYVYVVDPVVDVPDPADSFRVNGLVELLPIDNTGTYLAMERSFSVGKGNVVRIFEISSAMATDVSGSDDLYDEATGTAADFDPVTKSLVFDFAGFVDVVDNIEGMTFGPDLPDGRKTVIVVSDNNFNPGQFTQFAALAVRLDPAP